LAAGLAVDRLLPGLVGLVVSLRLKYISQPGPSQPLLVLVAHSAQFQELSKTQEAMVLHHRLVHMLPWAAELAAVVAVDRGHVVTVLMVAQAAAVTKMTAAAVFLHKALTVGHPQTQTQVAAAAAHQQ